MTCVFKPCSVRGKPWSSLDCALLLFTALTVLCIVVPMCTPGLYADTGVVSLTDMFQTKSFRGSAEALKHAGLIGMILHYAISWFSFLGLCLTLYQKFITFLYLSSRNMFDRVYDIKVNKMKGSVLGYKELFSSLFVQGDNGSQGMGLDVIITFVYSLLPNIKAYCDYCPDALEKNKLQETDGISQYMLKTAFPTITLLFFLTIGWSGTLAKAYGVVIDGMAAAADVVVSQNLASMVRRKLGSFGTHKFVLGSSGTNAGAYAEKVATEMYHKMLGECSGVNDTFKTRLGMVIEASVLGDQSSPLYVPPENASAIGVPGILAGGFEEDANVQNLLTLVERTLPEAAAGSYTFGGDADLKSLKSPRVDVINASSSPGNIGLVWSMDKVFYRALDVPVDGGGSDESDGGYASVRPAAVSKYLHVIVSADVDSKSTYLIKENTEKQPSLSDGLAD